MKEFRNSLNYTKVDVHTLFFTVTSNPQDPTRYFTMFSCFISTAQCNTDVPLSSVLYSLSPNLGARYWATARWHLGIHKCKALSPPCIVMIPMKYLHQCKGVAIGEGKHMHFLQQINAMCTYESCAVQTANQIESYHIHCLCYNCLTQDHCIIIHKPLSMSILGIFILHYAHLLSVQRVRLIRLIQHLY